MTHGPLYDPVLNIIYNVPVTNFFFLMHRPVFAPYGEFFCLFLWDFFFFFRNSTLIIFRKVKLRVLSQWDILNLPCYWKNLKVAACFFCLLRNLATTGEVFENAANSLTRVTTCAKFEEGKLGIK